MTPLMAPPYTDPAHAHNAVMTAASANDSSTPDQPLGNGMPVQRTRRTPRSRCSAGNLTEALCNEMSCRTHRFP